MLSSFANRIKDNKDQSLLLLQSTVAGETGPPGALAVHRVGLVQVSGAGNAIIRPQVPVANSVRDFLWGTDLVMNERVLEVCIKLYSKVQFLFWL